MKLATSFLAVAILMPAASPSHARGEGDIWIMFVGPMCLAQNPAYANTGLGKLLLHGTDVNTYIQQPFAECFRKRNWASRQLCDDIMSLQEEQMKDLEPVFERHRDEIRGMSAAFAYFTESLSLSPPTFARPACPESAK